MASIVLLLPANLFAYFYHLSEREEQQEDTILSGIMSLASGDVAIRGDRVYRQYLWLRLLK
ncbi:hypothetical protein ACLBOM_17315 [Escherichia coli]